MKDDMTRQDQEIYEKACKTIFERVRKMMRDEKRFIKKYACSNDARMPKKLFFEDMLSIAYVRSGMSWKWVVSIDDRWKKYGECEKSPEMSRMSREELVNVLLENARCNDVHLSGWQDVIVRKNETLEMLAIEWDLMTKRM